MSTRCTAFYCFPWTKTRHFMPKVGSKITMQTQKCNERGTHTQRDAVAFDWKTGILSFPFNKTIQTHTHITSQSIHYTFTFYYYFTFSEAERGRGNPKYMLGENTKTAKQNGKREKEHRTHFTQHTKNTFHILTSSKYSASIHISYILYIASAWHTLHTLTYVYIVYELAYIV